MVYITNNVYRTEVIFICPVLFLKCYNCVCHISSTFFKTYKNDEYILRMYSRLYATSNTYLIN